MMDTKATQTIFDLSLLAPGDKVIAAVSGGADSVALFHFLRRFCAENQICFYAAHVNHGLRDSADRDEAFVRQLCEKAGVPLFVCHARLGEKGLHSEEDARRARYTFFDKLAADYSAKVATAHTANDNAETVLFRMARGTSLEGAAGILPKRGIYIRPVLYCSRNEILAYCEKHGLAYMQDETNDSDRYARNRIRHHALPALCTVNSKAVENLAAFAKEAGELAAYIEQQADILLDGQKTEVLAKLLQTAPSVVRKAALAKLVAEFVQVDRLAVEGCEKVLWGKQHKYELTRGVYVALRKEHLVFWKEIDPVSTHTDFFVGACTDFEGYSFEILVCNMAEMIKICKQDKKLLKNFADYDMITDNPIFRTRRAGDRFAPQNRHLTKNVSDLFAEEKLSLPKRAALPLLAKGKKVLWIYGHGFAESVKPGENTRQVYYIKEDSKPLR